MNQIDFYEAKLNFETDSWDLFEAMRNREDIIIIDARSQQAFETEHIPSAVSLPHAAMTELTTTKLDKTKTYVTYCDGIGCNASTKGALKLSSLGFKTKELLGGLDWWKRDGYATNGQSSTPGKSFG